MKNEDLQRLAQAASEAIHAPVFKVSASTSAVATGASAVSVRDGIAHWFASGPGMVALASLAMTLLTLLVGVWSAWRRDRRDQSLHEAKLRVIDRVGLDSDAAPLDAVAAAVRHRRAGKHSSTKETP